MQVLNLMLNLLQVVLSNLVHGAVGASQNYHKNET